MFGIFKTPCSTKALLPRFPKLSNMFPNPSKSDPPRFRSASRSFGGVAVLALAKLLVVIARSLTDPLASDVSTCAMPNCVADPGLEDCAAFRPKEKVRPAALTENAG